MLILGRSGIPDNIMHKSDIFIRKNTTNYQEEKAKYKDQYGEIKQITKSLSLFTTIHRRYLKG